MAHAADAKRALDERGYTGTLIHNDNPLKLFEKPVRDRITDSYYWKEQCFGLNAATLLDRAVELTFVGGTYGVAQKPSPFLCLAFKMLQLLPEREVVEFYLRQVGEEFKYVRALACFYVRLAWEKEEEVYEVLEGLLGDGRKLKRRTREGWVLTWVDQFVDDLLGKSRICGTTLPRLNPRGWLEDEGRIEARVSALGEELDEMEDASAVEEVDGNGSGAEDTERLARNGHDVRDDSDDENADGDINGG